MDPSQKPPAWLEHLKKSKAKAVLNAKAEEPNSNVQPINPAMESDFQPSFKDRLQYFSAGSKNAKPIVLKGISKAGPQK